MSPELIFDFHVRLTGTASADDLLATMDGCGISRAAVAAGGVIPLDQVARQIVHGGHDEASPDNDRVREECARSGGRLVPIYFANPHASVAQYRAEASGYAGVEISPAVHGVGLDDPRTSAIVAVAAAARHSVYVVPLGRPGTRVDDLVTLARRNPEVTFVLGHCGFIGIDTYAINLVAPQPNIVAETSGCFTAVARCALGRLGPDRVVFGTEAPLQHPSVELAKFAALDLPASTWTQVAWHNAHRLIREDPS